MSKSYTDVYQLERIGRIHKQLERCYDEFFGDSDEDMEEAFSLLDNMRKELEAIMKTKE